MLPIHTLYVFLIKKVITAIQHSPSVFGCFITISYVLKKEQNMQFVLEFNLLYKLLS